MYEHDKSFRDFLDNFKASHSCVDYLSTLGFNIPYSGYVILTPSQIRADDHNPSFAVYHSMAHDFGTHQSYDIFALDMIFHNRSFIESVEALTGYRFNASHSVITSRFTQNRNNLQENIRKWHEILLSNPKVFREAQQREEGPLDYLLDRKLTLEYIKREQIGYDPERKRIMFPYRKNGQFAYVAGRDFSGRAELPKDKNTEHVNKYWKHPIMDGLEHCPWGLHTIRGQKRKGSKPDADFYETPLMDNPKDDTLIICEGMVDVSVFAQNGWQCLSPVGGSFRKTLIPEVLDIARMFKRVFICFDNDTKGCEFQRTWASRLFEAQIPFVCGHTAGDGQPKFDVADYYRAACNNAEPGQDEQAAGAHALEELVRKAVPGVVEISKSLYSYERIASFLEESARFCRPYDLLSLRQALSRRTRIHVDELGVEHEVPMFGKQELSFLFSAAAACPPEQQIAEEVLAHHTLTYSIDDAFYEFDGIRWAKRHDLQARRYIYSVLGSKAGDNRVSKILRTMKTLLADTHQFDTQHVFTFSNGTLLLDEDDEAGNRGRLVRSSPEYRASISVPYAYDATARNTLWEKTVLECFCGDTALAREFQKACGSILMPDNSLHKMYYLIGDGRNGKSLLLSLIREVFGPENGASVRPDRLADQFAPMALKGKLYNICFEGGPYLKGAEETLKGIVAGDPIMAAHKGVDAIEFTPRAKLFVAANNMFNARDLSAGFLARFVFFPFNNTFEPGDPDLAEKLKLGLAGIFNWCLEGYRMLMREGFIECSSQSYTRRKFEEHIEPLRVFMRETFAYNFESFRPLKDNVVYSEYPSLKTLYTCYKNWSLENGYTCPNRGEFTDRMIYLSPRLERAEGLKPLSIATIDGVEYLIIRELDERILQAYMQQAGRVTTRHMDYLLKVQQEEQPVQPEKPAEKEKETENELPADTHSDAQEQEAAEIPEPELPDRQTEHDEIQLELPDDLYELLHSQTELPPSQPEAPYSALFENKNLRQLVRHYELATESIPFILQHRSGWVDRLIEKYDLARLSGGDDFEKYGVGILISDPELAPKFTLQLILAVYDMVSRVPSLVGTIENYEEWLRESERLVIKRLKSYDADLTGIPGIDRT